MQDSLSNFLNKLKMAYRAHKSSFLFPASRFIDSVAQSLQKHGFVGAVGKKGKKGRYLDITLAYEGERPKMGGVRRVSRPSKRMYASAREIRPVRQGFGAAILSTPKGILSDKEARTARVGGEVLFEIW